MNIPEKLRLFNKKDGTRVAGIAAGIAAMSIALLFFTYRQNQQLTSINSQMAVLPDIAGADASAGGRKITKDAGVKLEVRTKKYEEIQKEIEKYIPTEGGDPAPLNINDIVLNIPASIDVERSIKSEDAPQKFSEDPPPVPGAFIDPRIKRKPVYDYHSLAFSFSLRSNFNSLVKFLHQLDQLQTYYILRGLTLFPLPPELAGGPGTKDKRFGVELSIFTIYLPAEKE